MICTIAEIQEVLWSVLWNASLAKQTWWAFAVCQFGGEEKKQLLRYPLAWHGQFCLVYLLVFNVRSFKSRYFLVQSKLPWLSISWICWGCLPECPCSLWWVADEPGTHTEIKGVSWLFKEEIGRRMELAGKLTNESHRSCCIIHCPAPAASKGRSNLQLWTPATSPAWETPSLGKGFWKMGACVPLRKEIALLIPWMGSRWNQIA